MGPATSQSEEASLLASIDRSRLPGHVAIIMDGNGRWAKKHRFQRIRGHSQGIKTVREVVNASRNLGISVLTLYAFSEENWNRPKREVSALMSLLKRYLISERKELNQNNIRVISTGNVQKLPPEVRVELKAMKDLTAKNGGMVLNLALSYGGRDEIIRAVHRYIASKPPQELETSKLTQDQFSNYLDTAGLPDPDLLIRTSGEQRISNFMLWQIAYTEIYVTDVLWPDFKKADLYGAVIEFQKRERRFGLISEQLRGKRPSDATL